MFNRIFVVIIFAAAVMINSAYAKDRETVSAEYMSYRIPAHNHRFESFRKALDLLRERGAKVLIETGTAGDGCKGCITNGCSTLIFGDWARDHQAKLYSVDRDPEAIERAYLALPIRSREFVEFIQSDSVEFLENFDRPVDFIYLDSFPYEITHPVTSQRHNLNEIKAIYPKLHRDSIVLIDDCDLPGGGKGKRAIEYLLDRGWVIIYKGYQVLMIRRS